MKTFGHKFKMGTISRGLILMVFLLLTSVVTAWTQGVLTGYIVDDEFDEPLEKAVVTIPGTLISVLTDQQGKFSIKLVGGDYFLEVNCPGYFRKQYNMAVSDGITTPMFIIKLKANAVGRARQRSMSSRENKHFFSQSAEDFSIWQIDEQNGNQEFNQLFERIPSVSFHSNGNGFNDSDLGFRANSPTLTSYTFNGLLLNNPETGRMRASLLSGLTDWAGQIQAISGQAANLQSQTASGGLINVLSQAPHEKAGADLMAVYGNNGFLKTSATVHSGLSKSGFASSVQFSRTSGDGIVQNAAFEQYSFSAQIYKEFSQFHTLILNLNGVVQQHDRNPADSIGAYNLFGTKYNRQWSLINEKPVSWSTSFGRTPLISLTHFWQPRVKTQITTQIFAQFDRSGQLISGISEKNLALANLPHNLEGQIAYGKIINPTDSLGLQIPPIHAETDRENRFGVRSVISHTFSKKFDLSGSIDLQQYKASHSGAVHNLLSAAGFTSFSDINRPGGFNVQNLFNSGFFQSYQSADKTDYAYESAIRTGGLSFRMNYRQTGLYWYLAGSASVNDLRRTDQFNYLAADPAKNSGSDWLPGGHAQTGIRVNLWKYHSIFLRASYGSYQPLFTTVFPSENNWKNEQATNEQVFDTEFGYTIFSQRLKIEATAYRTQVLNRSMVRYLRLNQGDSYALINGLEEIHQGVELKTSYKLTRNFQLNVNGSLGDWHYEKDAKAILYDSNNQQTASNDLWIKGVHIANAPQFSLFAEAEYRWANNFYIRLNYSRADQIYAPFGVYDFKDLAVRSDFKQWRMPAYDLLGFSANYLVRLTKKLSANFILGGQNLLDTEYIEQSATNFNEKNPHYTSNLVNYGMGRTWFGGIRVQF